MTDLLIFLRRFALYRALTHLLATSPAFRLMMVALIPVIWIVLANAAPLIQMIAISFYREFPVPVGEAPVYSLTHYQSLFERPLYLNAFIRSFVFAFAVTAVTLIVVFPVAYYISKVAPRNQRTRMLLLVVAPFWVSEIIRSFAWIVMLANRGAVNSFFGWLGLPGVPYELLYNGFSMMVGVVYLSSLYMLLPLYAAIEKIDDNLLEAAANLGASGRHRLTRIILPLARPGIVAGCTLVFLLVVGLYAMPQLLGGPDTTLFPATIAQIFSKAGASWPQGSAFSLMLTLAALTIAGLFIAVAQPRRRLGR